jgi:hypothetical protein
MKPPTLSVAVTSTSASRWKDELEARAGRNVVDDTRDPARALETRKKRVGFRRIFGCVGNSRSREVLLRVHAFLICDRLCLDLHELVNLARFVLIALSMPDHAGIASLDQRFS